VVSLIPLSIVLASIVLPMMLASSPKPKRALRGLRITMALLMLVWAILCTRIYPLYVLAE
jgi:predicted membrane protein